jgi:hypothetical protein
MKLEIKKVPKKRNKFIDSLPKLNPMIMPYFSNTLMVAPTNTGKTNMAINLLDRKEFYGRKFDKIYLFSSTFQQDDLWRSCKTVRKEDMTSIYLQLNDKNIQAVLNEQTEAKKSGEPINSLMILDDMMYELHKCKLMQTLLTRNRHFYLTIWITTQKYNTYVSPIIRNNCRFFILFGISNKKEREVILDELSGKVSEQQLEMMWNYARGDHDYNFLVIDTRSPMDKMFRKQFLSYIEVKEHKDDDTKESCTQSVMFPKGEFSVASSREWLKKHNLLANGKVDGNFRDNYYAFRQRSPDEVRKKGYSKFRSRKLPNGVILIMVYKE